MSRAATEGGKPGVALAYAALYPQNTAACVAVAPFGADCGAGTAWLARIRRPTLVVAGELPALEAPEAHREVVIDFLRANR